MKKVLGLLLGGVLLTSCSSTGFSDMIERESRLADSVIEANGGPKEFPEWTKDSGVKGGYVYMVGTFVSEDIEVPEHHMISAAAFDAKGRILQDAPTEYKAIVKSALGTALGTYGEFNKVEEAVTQVKNLTGFRTNKKQFCRLEKVITMKTVKLVKSCKVQGMISLKDLNKAYEYTVNSLYGESKATKFKKALSKESKRRI